MRLKLFSIFSVIYLLLIAGFVYEQNLGVYEFSCFGLSLSLPIFIWVCLPCALLFLFALLHMSFYGFLNFLSLKGYKNDYSKFDKFLKNILLLKKDNTRFKTKEFKEIKDILEAIFSKKETKDEEINEIINLKSSLDKGCTNELKKYSLSKENPLFLQNEDNKISSDLNFAKSLIKNKKELKSSQEKEAYLKVINEASYSFIKELKIPKSQGTLAKILQRYEEDKLELKPAEIDVLLDINKLDEKGYYMWAKALLRRLEPSALLALYKKLLRKSENAKTAYLYLLAQLGMYDELLLELNAKDGGYEDFKLVLFLHEHNKTFSTSKIVQMYRDF